MRWRLLRLNWAYGVGELGIVVLGVMIALGFEQWNSDRLDRVEEGEIVDRFIADLQVDLEDLSAGLNILAEKEVRLQHIYATLVPPVNRPTDEARFLEDVAVAAGYGWDQAHARRTTFDEVLASGKFSLIRDTTIRVKIADYYEGDSSDNRRIDERETQFPGLSYGLVPQRDGRRVSPDLSDEELGMLVDEVLASLPLSLVIAESNFASFVAFRFTDWQDRCLALIDALEVYRESIGQ